MSDEFTLKASFLTGVLVVLSLFVCRYFWSDPIVRPFPSYLCYPDNYQLDAIPTVGFSDPILSYFSAIRFIFDGVSMLKEGYQKVIFPFSTNPPFVLSSITLLPLDKTRSIQNCQISEMDGAGCRACANRRRQEGTR
jgi:hypothetical protein